MSAESAGVNTKTTQSKAASTIDVVTRTSAGAADNDVIFAGERVFSLFNEWREEEAEGQKRKRKKKNYSRGRKKKKNGGIYERRKISISVANCAK